MNEEHILTYFRLCFIYHCKYINLFVCLFVGGLSSHSRIFHSYGGVTIADEGMDILTYARHSWPLSSECSLPCHTHCDTAHPFIMVISEDPWQSHLFKSVKEWSCHHLFLFRPVAAEIRTANLPLACKYIKREFKTCYCLLFIEKYITKSISRCFNVVKTKWKLQHI